MLLYEASRKYCEKLHSNFGFDARAPDTREAADGTGLQGQKGQGVLLKKATAAFVKDTYNGTQDSSQMMVREQQEDHPAALTPPRLTRKEFGFSVPPVNVTSTNAFVTPLARVRCSRSLHHR